VTDRTERIETRGTNPDFRSSIQAFLMHGATPCRRVATEWKRLPTFGCHIAKFNDI